METATPDTSRPAPAAVDVHSKVTGRLLFVDNIRVFLTIVVVLFHLMITYAGTGSWYYTEGREDFITGATGAWFLTVTQAYFMGFFLLISGYFVPGSYDRKGAGRFLKDRLIRLGIPLALYSWIIRPLLAFLDPVRFPGSRPPFWSFITGNYFREQAVLGAGPLWFIEILLIFSILYVLWRLLTRPRPDKPVVDTRFPGNGSIALFALLLGVVAFLIRIWLPLGWNFVPLNLQFPFFVQYIALFVVGLIAYRRNWLLHLPDTTGRVWLGIGILLIFLFWPLVLGGGALDRGLDPFRGGIRWQALAYALWESFLGLGMCIGLIYAFRHYANRQGKLASFLSRNAYTAYLIHEVVIIAIAYSVRDVALYPLLKWVVVALVAVPLCFALSSPIRKLPYADRVL
jgi:surface polysaccharide O-acyltransferase-like enzyme